MAFDLNCSRGAVLSAVQQLRTLQMLARDRPEIGCDYLRHIWSVFLRTAGGPARLVDLCETEEDRDLIATILILLHEYFTHAGDFQAGQQCLLGRFQTDAADMAMIEARAARRAADLVKEADG